jgi:hypothetical protein
MTFTNLTDVFTSVWRGFTSRSNDRYPFNFSFFNSSARFNDYGSDLRKRQMALTNPAMLKVIAIQCDLFSLGKITVEDANGKEIETDPFLNLIGSPNPFQTKSQFLWDAMFWEMLGNAYCYIDSKVVDGINNKLYFLDPSKMHWPQAMQKDADKLMFSGSSLADLKKSNITYRYTDGTSIEIPLDRIIHIADLTNGVGNWLKGPSKVDALTKIISNSEHAIDAKNINVRYSGKFLVGAKTDPSKMGLGDEEKKSIRDNVDDQDQRVWPVKADINIRRFVEDMGALRLGEAYLEDYFIIGSMYGIPRDVLEAYQSSTYENQEKARASHVSYCLEPKGNDLMDRFERHFNYVKDGKNIKICWNHLPFMQVFEKDKNDAKKSKADTLVSLINLGVPIKECNEFLGTDFTIEKPEVVPPTTGEAAGVNPAEDPATEGE